MTHYDVLGVASDADVTTIRQAYRRRARKSHPDLGGSNAEFAAIATAWSVLSDARARTVYDDELQRGPGADAWGEDVGFGFTAPARPSPKPNAAPPAGATGEHVLDPFLSAPRTLPSLDDELAPLPRPNRPPSRAKDLLFLVLSVVAVFVAFAPLAMSPDAESSGDTGRGIIVYAVLLYLSSARRKNLALDLAARRQVAVAFFWGTVGAFSLLALTTAAATPTGPARRAAMLSALVQVGGGVLVLALTERHVYRARRWSGALAEIRARRELADAWNEFLSARDLFGGAARMERGTAVYDGPPRPVWALVDRATGTLWMSAPEGAPEAWSETLRRGSADTSARSTG